MGRSWITANAALAVACALCAGPAAAQSGADATARANRMAYDAAMKCFVANGHAIGLRERAGDTVKAAYYETRARLSFDTAMKLGAVLRLSGSRIDQDFRLAQTRELPPMVTDETYFLDAVATCKALGLM
ncbi:MAG: hypothetical protein Q8L23_00975 [Caulobacter sp.]|nr:hypothetical protein [Caulobacter sp.]